MSPATSFFRIPVVALAAFCAGRLLQSPVPEKQAALAIKKAASSDALITIPFRPALEVSQIAADPFIDKDSASFRSRFEGIRSVRDRMEFVAEAMRHFAAEDPHGAILFAASLPPGPWRTPAVVQALEILANAGESGEALQSLDRLVPIHDRNAAMLSIAAAWAKRSPFDAMEWSAALNDEILRSSAMENAISSWAESDPAGALRWISTNAHAADADHMIGTVTAAWAAADPLSALSWAKAQYEANPEGPNPVITVYQEWTNSDPDGAAIQLIGEEPSMQQSVIPGLLKSWIETDAAAASNWSSQLSDPESRTAAASILAQHANRLVSRSPSIADESIEIETMRSQAD